MLLNPRRIPHSKPSLSVLLRISSPINPPLHRVTRPCIRCFQSRWNPDFPPPKQILRIPSPEIPQDPKDYMPEWPALKEDLLRRAKNADEVQIINELLPEEVGYILSPDRVGQSGDVAITRAMPVNMHYFSGQPDMEQRLQNMEKMYDKYNHLPKTTADKWPLRDWKNAGFNDVDGFDPEKSEEKAMSSRVRRLMLNMGRELNKIHPAIMPPELKRWLDAFAPLRVAGSQGRRQTRTLDKYGRSRGNGKRKTSRAKVQIVPGEGQVYVNGKLASEFFTRLKDVENVIWPLQSLSVLGKYNVWVSTWGGGMTGQSEACKLAVARAMLAHDQSGELNLYRRILRKAGCLKADGRNKERKKPGLKAARARRQWVKR